MKNEFISDGSNVIITDIGEGADAALICMTNLPACCNSAASGGTRRGDWSVQNTGAVIGGRRDGGGFYVTRSAQSQVLLQRRNNTLEPLGKYCCEVETVARSNAIICVNGE